MTRTLPLLFLCAVAHAAEVVVPPAPPPVFTDKESVANVMLPAIACDWTLEGFSWRDLSLVLSVPEIVVQFPSLSDIITDLGVQGRMIDSWDPAHHPKEGNMTK